MEEVVLWRYGTQQHARQVTVARKLHIRHGVTNIPYMNGVLQDAVLPDKLPWRRIGFVTGCVFSPHDTREMVFPSHGLDLWPQEPPPLVADEGQRMAQSGKAVKELPRPRHFMQHRKVIVPVMRGIQVKRNLPPVAEKFREKIPRRAVDAPPHLLNRPWRMPQRGKSFIQAMPDQWQGIDKRPIPVEHKGIRAGQRCIHHNSLFIAAGTGQKQQNVRSPVVIPALAVLRP